MQTNKFCIMAILTILALAVPICAKSESIIMGPYTVSFDMGNVGGYTINEKPPQLVENLYGERFTIYQANIVGGFSKATIGINEYDNPVINNAGDALTSVLKSSSNLCGEPMVIARIIDGKPGVLGSIDCFGSISYLALYPLDYLSKSNNMTSAVMFESSYPWDEGTSSLVKSIHVEKK